MLNQVNDLVGVVHSAIRQQEDVSLLVFIGLGCVENCSKRLINLCAAKVSLKTSDSFERVLEILVVVFNTALAFK